MKMQNEIKTEVIETKYEYVQVHNTVYHINSDLQEHYKKGWEPHLFSTTMGSSGTVYTTYVLKRKIKNK